MSDIKVGDIVKAIRPSNIGDFKGIIGKVDHITDRNNVWVKFSSTDEQNDGRYFLLSDLILAPDEQNKPKEASDTITLSLTLPEGTDSLVGQFKASNGHKYFIDARRVRD